MLAREINQGLRTNRRECDCGVVLYRGRKVSAGRVREMIGMHVSVFIEYVSVNMQMNKSHT